VRLEIPDDYRQLIREDQHTNSYEEAAGHQLDRMIVLADARGY
jgi:hypothetical protein